jgi:hypothetical protein
MNLKNLKYRKLTRALNKPLRFEYIDVKFLLFVVLSIFICLKVNGYRAGTWDHWVLSPKGISWTDDSSFINDWTIFHAPQPHVFFDLFTAIGTYLNVLSWFYLGYFFVTITVLCLAYWILCKTFFNNFHFSCGTLAVLILSISPKYLLGTGVPFLGIALPALLASGLALLSLAYLINDHTRAAMTLSIPTTLMHVQLGLALTSLLLIVLFFEKDKWQRKFILSSLQVATSILCGVVLLNLRPVYGNLKDFTWVCQNMIPYHCDANSWTLNTLITGSSSLGLLLVSSFISTNHKWRLITRSLCLIELFAVSSDYLNIPLVGEFVQGSNLYRYGMFVSALTPIAIIFIFLSTYKGILRFATLEACGFLFSFLYLCSEFTILSNKKVYVGIFIVVAYLISIRNQILSSSKRKIKNFQSVTIFLSTTSLLSILVFTPLSDSHIQINLESETSTRALLLRDLVRPGGIIASDPRMTWVRLESRRAVIVDCKYAPYGGPALREYRQRLSSLGGWHRACSDGSFVNLSSNELDSFVRRYGAEYILIESTALSNGALSELGWKVKTKISQTENYSSFPSNELILYSLD